MNDEAKRQHAAQQLRAAQELYQRTQNPIYLNISKVHEHTLAQLDARRQPAAAPEEAKYQASQLSA